MFSELSNCAFVCQTATLTNFQQNPLSTHLRRTFCILYMSHFHKGSGAKRRFRFLRSLMDGCGEAGETQRIHKGPNFVATSLHPRSNFVATLADLECGLGLLSWPAGLAHRTNAARCRSIVCGGVYATVSIFGYSASCSKSSVGASSVQTNSPAALHLPRTEMTSNYTKGTP